MNRNDNHHEEVVMTASSGNSFDEHMHHCNDCRNDVMSSSCQEGNRVLRETVRNGTAHQSDRDLDRLRNGDVDLEE